jgi:hypothetical protein
VSLTWRRGNFNVLAVSNKSVAERKGFEPPLPFQVDLISNQAPSATRPPLPRLMHPRGGFFRWWHRKRTSPGFWAGGEGNFYGGCVSIVGNARERKSEMYW